MLRLRSLTPVTVSYTHLDVYKRQEYPVAVVEGHNNATVIAFYDYLKGPQAAEIFNQFGGNTIFGQFVLDIIFRQLRNRDIQLITCLLYTSRCV